MKMDTILGHAVTNSSNAPQGESTNQPLSKAPRRIYKLGVQMYIHSNKQFLGTLNGIKKLYKIILLKSL